MDTKRAFDSQRSNAKARGIEWRLTFDEWLAWWGSDLANRGKGREKLQMQRFGDIGPYALDNIRKGHPADNGKTRRIAEANRASARAKARLHAALDAAMWLPSAPAADELKHPGIRSHRHNRMVHEY